MANNDTKDNQKQPSKDASLYAEYEKGTTVQELADKYKLAPGEVLATIQAVQESKKK